MRMQHKSQQTQCKWVFILLVSASAAVPFVARAQVSLTTVVDLALRNSPRIKSAQADVIKSRAALSEAKDIYIPSVTIGAGLGQSYGYSPNPPTLFTTNGQSLVYSASQRNYIRSARSGLNASEQALEDSRQVVAEDVALTYLAVEHDQQREKILGEEVRYAATLVGIVQERLDAGRDNRMDLTTAKLSSAQIRLALLRTQDEEANDRGHLARLTGLPSKSLRVDSGLPHLPASAAEFVLSQPRANPAVAAAFLNAQAKQLLAEGDARYLYRPQVSLVAQYSRYATFTNSFKQIQTINSSTIGANEGVIGVQISLPLLDKTRQAKNKESAADASRSLHEAEGAQASALDGQDKLTHTIEELEARADVASLEQQLAQQQLEVIQLQLVSPIAGAVPMTPKDEQNSRVAEREKYLGVVDTNFQLHQAEVSLLRQTGQLLAWLSSAATASATPRVTP